MELDKVFNFLLIFSSLVLYSVESRLYEPHSRILLSQISLPPEAQPPEAQPPSSVSIDESNSSSSSSSSAAIFSVMSFGAVGDGVTDDTQAFKMAWDAACHAIAPSATVLVPNDYSFMIQSTIFTGPCSNGIIFKVIYIYIYTQKSLCKIYKSSVK